MLNKMVEVKEMELVGKVFDMNDKYYWIEANNDFYCVEQSKVSEIVEKATCKYETLLSEIENALAENDFDYDVIGEGEGAFTLIIQGNTYDVMCGIDFTDNTYDMDTSHKGRDDGEWCNKQTFKRYSTLIRNVIKWAEKF